MLTLSLLDASFWRKINKPILNENASNLTNEIFVGNLTRKLSEIFFLKLFKKNVEAFPKQNGSFIFLKKDELRRKIVNCEIFFFKVFFIDYKA